MDGSITWLATRTVARSAPLCTHASLAAPQPVCDPAWFAPHESGVRAVPRARAAIAGVRNYSADGRLAATRSAAAMALSARA